MVWLSLRLQSSNPESFSVSPRVKNLVVPAPELSAMRVMRAHVVNRETFDKPLDRLGASSGLAHLPQFNAGFSWKGKTNR
jgi:hypothetical protein